MLALTVDLAKNPSISSLLNNAVSTMKSCKITTQYNCIWYYHPSKVQKWTHARPHNRTFGGVEDLLKVAVYSDESVLSGLQAEHSTSRVLCPTPIGYLACNAEGTGFSPHWGGYCVYWPWANPSLSLGFFSRICTSKLWNFYFIVLYCIAPVASWVGSTTGTNEASLMFQWTAQL